MIWKPSFDIWWHRVIITFTIALFIAVAMFFIHEKPFSDESQLRYQQVYEDDHYDPPATPDDHHDDGE